MLDTGSQSQLVHGVEDPTLNRLLAVLDVGDRPAAHHAHRVGEVAPFGEGPHVDRIIAAYRRWVRRPPVTLSATFAPGPNGRRPRPLAGPAPGSVPGDRFRRRFVRGLEKIERSVLCATPAARSGVLVHTSASTVLPFSSIHVQRFSASFFDISMLKSL